MKLLITFIYREGEFSFFHIYTPTPLITASTSTPNPTYNLNREAEIKPHHQQALFDLIFLSFFISISKRAEGVLRPYLPDSAQLQLASV